jgi:hypothetical protein
MPHEDCVNLIKRAGDTLALKVVTANMSSHYAATHSLPYRRKGKNFLKENRDNMRIYFQLLFIRVLKNLLVVFYLHTYLACLS